MLNGIRIALLYEILFNQLLGFIREMAARTKPLPPLWGSDSLTEHLDGALNNIFASTAKGPPEYPLLVELDGAFQTIAHNLNSVRNVLEGLLLFRCHAAFRAACMLSMSGHNTEAFPMVRSCLEIALYAFHIAKNPSAGEVWINRHEDAESMKKMKATFLIKTVKDTLKASDPDLARTCEELYTRSIDFGGHPNERAVTASLTIAHEQGKRLLKQDYLAGGTIDHRHAIKTSAQAGLFGLLIFQKIYRERFEILGITSTLEPIRAKL